jgi:hypothetical protein
VGAGSSGAATSRGRTAEGREGRAWTRARELLPQVHALTTRADLLLAEAVKVKCTFRDDTTTRVWASTTQTGELQQDDS